MTCRFRCVMDRDGLYIRGTSVIKAWRHNDVILVVTQQGAFWIDRNEVESSDAYVIRAKNNVLLLIRFTGMDKLDSEIVQEMRAFDQKGKLPTWRKQAVIVRCESLASRLRPSEMDLRLNSGDITFDGVQIVELYNTVVSMHEEYFGRYEVSDEDGYFDDDGSEYDSNDGCDDLLDGFDGDEEAYNAWKANR